MNYFNTLPLRLQLEQLGKCRFMAPSEFSDGVNRLKGSKVVIVGCGAQGLNQGLNMRDSGLDVSFTLRDIAISEKRVSWKNATENGFTVGTYQELIPTADLVLNLTPDKQHSAVVKQVMPLMKNGACLAYSHGFNIVEVPVIFTDRTEGTSKMSGGIFFEAVIGVIQMKIKSFFRSWKK